MEENEMTLEKDERPDWRVTMSLTGHILISSHEADTPEEATALALKRLDDIQWDRTTKITDVSKID